jgi:hypothetical protein
LSTTQNFSLLGQILFQPVPFSTKVVDVLKHPGQQGFGWQGVYPRLLELQDLLPLPGDLDPHSFDFSPDVVEVRHGILPQ